jgi:hypothetical protein
LKVKVLDALEVAVKRLSSFTRWPAPGVLPVTTSLPLSTFASVTAMPAALAAPTRVSEAIARELATQRVASVIW